MKDVSLVWFGIIGGTIGFLIHYFWHIRMSINLFSISPHIAFGFIYTFIGIAIGIILWYFIFYLKRSKNFIK